MAKKNKETAGAENMTESEVVNATEGLVSGTTNPQSDTQDDDNTVEFVLDNHDGTIPSPEVEFELEDSKPTGRELTVLESKCLKFLKGLSPQDFNIIAHYADVDKLIKEFENV